MFIDIQVRSVKIGICRKSNIFNSFQSHFRVGFRDQNKAKEGSKKSHSPICDSRNGALLKVHDVACQSSCLVREEILDLEKQTVDRVRGKVSLNYFDSTSVLITRTKIQPGPVPHSG